MQNKIIKILFSIVAILSIGFGLYMSLTTDIPVLKTTIPAGTIVTSDNITTVKWWNPQLTDDIIRNGVDVVGKISTVEIQAGYALTDDVLEAQKTEDIQFNSSKITVSIPVNPQFVPSTIKKGDKVNILAFFKDGAVEGKSAFTIGFSDPSTVESVITDENGRITTLDLGVDKTVAVEVVTASSTGEIHIIKNYGNNSALKGSTTSDLYSKYFTTSSQIQTQTEEVKTETNSEVK